MQDYVIFTDASADIDRAFLQAHDVRFISMEYSVGEEQRVCEGPEPEDVLKRFYDAQRAGTHTQTSQITPQHYKDTFKPFLKEGISVLYLSLSSGLTKTYDSVKLAKAETDGKYPGAIYPVDTLSATGGMGLLVERAVANREAGMSVEENQADLREARHRVCHVFMVGDLMYLKRGGRVSAATAVVGTMLNIRPILVIDPRGKLITVAKKRGEKGGVREILARFAAARDPQAPARIYSCHGDAPDTTALLIDNVRKQVPELSAAVMPLCPVIGAHTGPEMVSLIFWGDREMICREE